MERSVEEIAIDEDLNGYAAGQAGRFHFDLATAVCDGPMPSAGSSATGLSFAPAKPGQAKATLWGFIAYATDTVDLYRVEASGEETAILLPPSRFRTNLDKFQGDIVTTNQGRTFATAGSGLFEIDLQTGAVITDYGDLGFENINGLASWGPTLYGFTGDGKIFEVVPTVGASKPTLLAQTEVPFSGAASVVPR